MSSTISTGIPSSFIVPGFYFSITPVEQPNVSIGNIVIMGQAIDNAGADAVLAADVATVASTYGLGSQIARMYSAYRKVDPVSTVYLIPLADSASGTAATVDVTVTGPATAAGTLHLYVAGQYVPVGVASGDSVSTIATNIAAAVNAQKHLPCTAAANAGDVTLTAKNAGVAAGDISVIANYYGSKGGQSYPAGVSISTVVTAGTGNPDISTALSNISDLQVGAFVMPYHDSQNLTSMTSTISTRWGYTVQQFGFCFAAAKDTLANLETLGQGLNTQYVSILGVPASTPTTVSEVAAYYAGAGIASLAADPALPVNSLPTPIMATNVIADRFDISERNTLLTAGIATTKVVTDTVVLERAVTTYKTDSNGIPDTSFRQVQTVFILSYVVQYFAQDLGGKFARVKLVTDGTPVPFGSNFVTPSTIKAEAVAVYDLLATQGLVVDTATFAKSLQAQDAGNGRVNLALPLSLGGPLEQIAVAFSFTATN